ncbi:MAG: DUF3826 domain-containing protein [Flavisolibacter sp.]|nr:DUF3826 domain-containing protein [Flavisolibacter sp.]
MKGRLLFLAVLLLPAVSVFVQGTNTAENKEAVYTRTIQKQVEKILTKLSISDSFKTVCVSNIITNQHSCLNVMHTYSDKEIRDIRAQDCPKEALRTQIQNIEGYLKPVTQQENKWSAAKTD